MALIFILIVYSHSDNQWGPFKSQLLKYIFVWSSEGGLRLHLSHLVTKSH